jgi:acyl CoA:acetate/3-ketoacid CoA transferase alpha subunit
MWKYISNKLVVMGCINFEDHALIKKWLASKKMNATSKMFKEKINRVIIKSNLRLLLEVICIFEVLEFTVA